MDSKKIGATIAMLRTSKNMTQADLGDRIGVTFQAVSKWERGETMPDISILPTLADVFETTIDYILRCGEVAEDYSASRCFGGICREANCRLKGLWNLGYRLFGLIERVGSEGKRISVSHIVAVAAEVRDLLAIRYV